MDRRAFLVTAAALVAGCGGGDSSDDTPTDGDDDGSSPSGPTDGDGSTPTDAPTATATATSTPEPASLSVTGVSTPSEIEIGEPFTVSATVENAGGQSGTFSAPVEARYGTGDWETTDATIEVEVPPGETATGAAELAPHPYVEPASFRLSGADPVARPRFVGRELAYGETHSLPNGIDLIVAEPEFRDLYTYETDEGTKEKEPTGDEKWAVSTVRAENTGDSPARAPLVSDIAFFRGEDQEFAYQHISGNQSRYEGGELDPGETSEGDLPSDVPPEAELGDLRVEHSQAYDGGQVTVNWRLDG